MSVNLETHNGERVIVIRVPVDALEQAMRENPRDDSYYDVKVTDAAEFAADVVRELNREEEDGTTPVHLLFDKALAAAVDNGSMGCEFTERKAKDSKRAGR